MKLIRKRNTADCLLCCAAMLTGNTYTYTRKNIIQTWDNEKKCKFVSVLNFCTFLNGEGLHYGVLVKIEGSVFIDDKNITVGIPLTSNALVTVPSFNFGKGWNHAVVWDGTIQKILDSSFKEPKDLKDYSRILTCGPISEL